MNQFDKGGMHFVHSKKEDYTKFEFELWGWWDTKLKLLGIVVDEELTFSLMFRGRHRERTMSLIYYFDRQGINEIDFDLRDSSLAYDQQDEHVQDPSRSEQDTWAPNHVPTGF